jgi:hypothetical protein
MKWKGCPPGLQYIYIEDNYLESMNFDYCRNVYIKEMDIYHEEYYDHTLSDKFIPYLPLVSKEKKELHYEFESIWWSCPNGVRYLEDVQELKEDLGMFM